MTNAENTALVATADLIMELHLKYRDTGGAVVHATLNTIQTDMTTVDEARVAAATVSTQEGVAIYTLIAALEARTANNIALLSLLTR